MTPTHRKDARLNKLKKKLRNTIFHERWREFLADVNKNCIPSKFFIFQENDFQSSQKMKGTKKFHWWLAWRLVSQTELSINDVINWFTIPPYKSCWVRNESKWGVEVFTLCNSVGHCSMYWSHRHHQKFLPDWSGTVNLNMVDSRFHLIQSFFVSFARFLSFYI